VQLALLKQINKFEINKNEHLFLDLKLLTEKNGKNINIMIFKYCNKSIKSGMDQKHETYLN